LFAKLPDCSSMFESWETRVLELSSCFVTRGTPGGAIEWGAEQVRRVDFAPFHVTLDDVFKPSGLYRDDDKQACCSVRTGLPSCSSQDYHVGPVSHCLWLTILTDRRQTHLFQSSACLVTSHLPGLTTNIHWHWSLVTDQCSTLCTVIIDVW